MRLRYLLLAALPCLGPALSPAPADAGPAPRLGKPKPRADSAAAKVYGLGDSGWRITAPPGFTLETDENHPKKLSGALEWSKRCGARDGASGAARIRLSFRAVFNRERAAGKVPFQASPLCLERVDELREGDHYGDLTYSARCGRSDVYELVSKDFLFILEYTYPGCPREQLLQSFLDSARSLAPIEPKLLEEKAPSRPDGPVPLLR